MVFESMFNAKSACESTGTNTTNPNENRRKKKKQTRPPKQKKSSPTVDQGISSSADGIVTKTDRRKRQKTGHRDVHGNSKAKGPSAEAMLLSSKLKEFSTQKRLKDCLDFYWSKENDHVRDGHHACIVVDCCGRCGNIQEGERIVKELMKSGELIPVQTKTALLKGYAHSGMISKAEDLYCDMNVSKQKKDRPNVRTLNTLLRGCLWTAATMHYGTKKMTKKGKNKGKGNGQGTPSLHKISGGVETLDKVWPTKTSKYVIPDTSSYEYSISLLSQALRCNDAKERIEDLLRTFKVSVSTSKHGGEQFRAEDPSVLETLGVSFLNISRAYTLLGEYTTGEKYAKKALDVVASATTISSQMNSSGGKFKSGGKRAWKTSQDSESKTNDLTRRDVSNSLFRAHKMSELKNDANAVMNACSSRAEIERSKDRMNGNGRERPEHDGSDDLKKCLARHLFTRVLYFSGGGTTDLSASQEIERNEDGVDQKYDPTFERLQLLNSLWFSFGLKTAFENAFSNTNLRRSSKVLNNVDYSQVLSVLGTGDKQILLDDGTIDFSLVFSDDPRVKSTAIASDSTQTNRPLNIELGSGFGEWAVFQAKSNPSNDYVAVELRSDRVGQMFTRAYLNNGQQPIRNLCSVGSECGSFLRSKVKEGSVSKIFVNHPEPPTQTFGANNNVLHAIANGAEEPAHMLNSTTLLHAAKCLDRNKGELIIVTDNRWYANLICSTALKLMKEHEGEFYSAHLKGDKGGIRQVEVFNGLGDSSSQRSNHFVILYEGQPNESIGHSTQKHSSTHPKGSTYFDRLWRKGAGNHAETEKRFIIVLCRSKQSVERGQRTFDRLSNARSGTPIENDKRHNNPGRAGGKKKNRKRSAAQQKARNERRLAKKKAKEGLA